MDYEEQLSGEVIGAAIEVHRIMGPGLLESVYQACMEHELTLRGVQFQAQDRTRLVYKGMPLPEYFVIDLFFPGRLVVELKAVDKLIPIHDAQLLTYLRLTNTHTGLLINFNVPVLKNGLKRMVL